MVATSTISSPTCVSGDLSTCEPTDLTALPVKLYTRRVFTKPMTRADIDANFPPEFELFRATGSTNAVVTGGQTIVETNMMGGDEVPCPFLLCGVCIQVTPELDSWSLPGAVVDTSVAANKPDVPRYTGLIAAAGENGIRQGSYEFGGGTQRAAVDLLLAYRLRFLLQCKFEMFDIPLSDIGCVDAAGNFQGSGTSLTPAAPGVQAGNAQYASIGSDFRFLPVNTFGANNDLPQAPVVQVMRGGIKFQGGLAGYYMCPAPVLLAPCCRVNMSLYDVNVSQARSRVKYEMSDLGTSAATTVAPDVWTTGNISGIASVGAAKQFTMGAGQLTFGVTMVGVNLTLTACRQYFQQGMPTDMMNMYKNIPGFPGLTT